MQKAGLLAALFLLLLTACREQTPGPTLPEGTQTLTGVLLPLPISVGYRGSHRFQREPGVDLAYAESVTVNLRRQEGKTVVLRGHFEPNVQVTDPPVFVIESLVAIVQEPVRSFSAPSLHVSFEAPESWRVQIGSGAVSIIEPTLPQPLIEIKREPLLSEPKGEPIVLDRSRALSVTFADQREQILLPEGSSALTFSFNPQDIARVEHLRKQWETFLASVRLSAAASKTSAPATSTNTGTTVLPSEAMPCGGPAGILCPAGMYCAVENLAENIGHCRALGQ